jgi:shikimate dehydrogenase
MGAPHAEVIGDPVAQSQSPLIHQYWLGRLGIEAEYRATRVTADGLAAFLAARRSDPDWRGCNVTIPHKQDVMGLLDLVEPGAREIGAVNCVYRGGGRLAGRNSDIDGVAAALDAAELAGAKVAVIGAGGGARAAIRYLLDRRVATVAILVRDPMKAAPLRRDGPGGRVETWPLHRCDEALRGAAVVINASPMGMDGAAEMPPALLACVAAHAPGTILFDMVYKPLETAFLAAGRANGGTPVDGLTMLIGQARAAFPLFFGQPAPPGGEQAVRALLTT